MAIDKLSSWKPFLSGLAKKINELIDGKIGHGDIEGKNGIQVTDAGAGSNLIIDAGELQTKLSDMQDTIDELTSRLDNASITAECNDDGTITVTLNL